VSAARFEGHGLTDEQIARIVEGSTPHPGATLTEPAVLARPLGELPATYIQCLLAGDELRDDVVKLLTSNHWRLVKMNAGQRTASLSKRVATTDCGTGPRRVGPAPVGGPCRPGRAARPWP
jgi:hypothetical protein